MSKEKVELLCLKNMKTIFVNCQTKKKSISKRKFSKFKKPSLTLMNSSSMLA